MAPQVYPNDLNDAELTVLSLLLPAPQPRSPWTVDVRRIVSGIVSVLHRGCAWRYLPREDGPWQTV